MYVDLPDGTPNPAFDALEARPAPVELGEPPARVELAEPPARPDLPPPIRESTPAGRAITALVLAGMGVLLLGLPTVGVVLLVRQRRAAARRAVPMAGPADVPPPAGPATRPVRSPTLPRL